jgi:hypothetical protein
MSYQPPKKKRRWVGPVVVLAVLIALVVAAFFVAEKLARDAAGGVIARPVQKALGSTAPVDIDLGPGLFLVQAAGGSLDHVTISTTGLPVGEGSAELLLIAEGLPLDMGGTADSVDATLTLDSTALQSVVPAGGTVSFTDGAFVVASQPDLGVGPTPVELTVVPTAADGVIALEVTAVSVNGEPVELAAVQGGAYGPVAAALVAPAPLCVSSYLPAALTLSSAAVQGNSLVLEFTGSAVKLGSLSTKGSCPAPDAAP